MAHFSYSQKPEGKFIEDSLTVGQPINFALSFKHDSNQEIFFPDSSFNFGKFLFRGKEAFPTKTKNNISLDSAVYKLISFEIDSSLSLALPVYLVYDLDSLKLMSISDTIIIKEQIKRSELAKAEIKSELDFVEFKDITQIFKQVSYVLLTLLVGLALLFIFKKQIKKQLELIRYKISHRKFIILQKQFEKKQLTSTKTNEALINWKTYLEKLEGKPITTFTTSEIYKYLKNERLLEALKEVDSAIYGKSVSGSVPFALIVLRNIAEERFNIFKEKIKLRDE